MTNNKKRHWLILTLHAASEDDTGYGDLAVVYRAVADLHKSLEAAAWQSEAGMKLWAGVEQLKELMEAALLEGPGNPDYKPPAFLNA